MVEKLSWEDEYNITIDLIVNEFNCEYAGCGSHQMELTVKTTLDDLQNLYEKLKRVKGINN